MKRLALIFAIVTLTAIEAHAQEFSLHLYYFINGGGTAFRTVVFGYDTAATDGFDRVKWFDTEFPGGEQEYPLDSFGDNDCRMSGRIINRPDFGDGGPIDIRKKPALDSFELKFEIDIIARGTASARLEWNKSLIPPIIKHIFLSSGIFPSKIRLDMTKQSQFDIPVKDSATLYDRMVLRVLYNQEELGVKNAEISLEHTVIYPTIHHTGEREYLWLETTHQVQTVITDMMGRQIYSTTFHGNPGVNELSLSQTLLPSGMYVVEVRDVLNGKLLSRQKLLVK